MAQTKFLITGATGGNAARQLLAQDHAVRVLAHRPDARDRSVRAGRQGSRCRSHRQHVTEIRAQRMAAQPRADDPPRSNTGAV